VKEYVELASQLAHEKDYDACAQVLIDQFSVHEIKVEKGQGLAYLIGYGGGIDYHKTLIPYMIGKGMHKDVAHILWGSNLFNAEPESVQLIWSEIRLTATLLVQGGGSLGKSYGFAAFFLLDWIEDPLWTCVKVVSLTLEHAMRNAFAHIKNLHRQSSIPLPGIAKGTSIQASNDEKQGIHLVAIPQGEDGSGRLQGFHPVPRKTPHPKFGVMSRVRACIDEAEEVPGGIWEDVDNMLITIDDVEHVKVAAAANPRDIDSKFAKRCEPENGWASVDIEHSVQWKSKWGWSVVRLDGARCQNVIQQKLIFPGLISWDGYKRYLLQGDTSPEYFTMARGWFPAKGLSINVVPRDFMEKAIARLNFTGPVTYLASLDSAFEGDDKAPMTIGRFGMATGYNLRGQNIFFDKPKYALQAESQFALLKNDPEGKMTQTPWMAHQVKMHCRNLSIKGVWMICDRTGNGTGLHDMLRSEPPEGLGSEVAGIHFGAAATELKLFADSSQKACDLYDGIVTELFFAARNFLEFDYLKISPSMDTALLTEQMCTRRFKPHPSKVRVEGKKEYKARGNRSPDEIDSLTLLVHLVRMRQGFEAVLIAGASQRQQEPVEDIVGPIQYMSFD